MTPAASTDRVSPSGWALLVFLTALNVLNFVDRQLISSLAPLLIADLGLTRAEIGLLMGFAFVVFYTLMGVLLGVAADRVSRTRLLAAGLTLWSGMTAASGLATSFVHLAVPRVLVGVGEATLTPAALSMLGDAIPRSRLGMATGVYYAGIPLGTALSLFVAGWMAPHFGWRACFLVLGLVGLLAVGLLFVFREPPRCGMAVGQALPTLTQIGDAVGQAFRTRPALGLVILGGTLLAYTAGSALHAVTWLVQERGFDFRTAAFTAGAIAAGAGFTGNLAGGWFADWCARRWRGGRLWSLVLMTVAATPVAVTFYVVPASSPLFYACWFVASASTTIWFGPVFAAVQELSPLATRSTVVGVALLVMNLGGVGPGPYVTGVLGDRSSLTVGLLSSLGVGLLAVVPFALGALSERRTAGQASETA
jgi:MFS family permease